MSQSTKKTSLKSNVAGLAAFVSRKSDIDTMLTRLQTLIDDHFVLSPEEVTWGHVALLADYAELLKRITKRAFKEGEYAI